MFKKRNRLPAQQEDLEALVTDMRNLESSVSRLTTGIHDYENKATIAFLDITRLADAYKNMKWRFIGAVFGLGLVIGHCATPAEAKKKGKHTGQDIPYTHTLVGDNHVFIRRDVGNQMVFLYDGIGREIPLCLFGTKIGKNYHVNEATFPILFESTPNTALFVSVVLDSQISCLFLSEQTLRGQ